MECLAFANGVYASAEEFAFEHQTEPHFNKPLCDKTMLRSGESALYISVEREWEEVESCYLCAYCTVRVCLLLT